MLGIALSPLRRCCAAVVLTLPVIGQQPLFDRVDAPPLLAPSVPFGDAARLVIEGGVLLVQQGDSRRELPCTRPDGCGTAHALATTVFGQQVLAAEHGLFVMDPAHPVVDAMDLRDGVPEGAALGLVADGTRLWFCTRDALAVVDVRFGYGYTFGAAEQVPPPPYTGISRDRGRLVLHTTSGAFGLRLQGEEPVGMEPQPSDGIAHDAVLAQVDGSVRFEAALRAASGKPLRARQRHSHLLQPLDDGVLRGLRPGEHTVLVYALDPDLRRTLVGDHSVHVPLPERYGTTFLPLAAVAAGILLLILAWPRRGRRRLGRATWRVAIVMVFGLQLLAALLGYGRSWPFMGFSMYTENYHEGSLLYKPLVRGCCVDGSIVELDDWQLGLHQDGYWQMLAEIVHGSEADLETLLATVQQRRRGARVIGFEFVDTRIRLTAQGPVDVAPTVLRRWRWSS